MITPTSCRLFSIACFVSLQTTVHMQCSVAKI